VNTPEVVCKLMEEEEPIKCDMDKKGAKYYCKVLN
jgi:hypothetical protein